MPSVAVRDALALLRRVCRALVPLARRPRPALHRYLAAGPSVRPHRLRAGFAPQADFQDTQPGVRPLLQAHKIGREGPLGLS